MATTMITMAATRESLAELSGRVEYRGERIIVTKHGKQVFALVSIEDLRRLERYEVIEAIQSEEQAEALTTEELREKIGIREGTGSIG